LSGTPSPDPDWQLVQPGDWPAPRGYANGVSARGRTVYVAGQIGWNPLTGAFESDDFVRQTEQALRNVAAVLAAADADPRHLVRLTWYVVDGDAYRTRQREIGAAYREVIGRHFPAMAAVFVAGLVEPRALVEIEATAVVPD